jgi:pyrimidine deaminase RibD-like protein
MRQDIPNEPESHGCMGTNLAARVQEIIASHPSTATGHQHAEEEILREITQALTQAQAPITK